MSFVQDLWMLCNKLYDPIACHFYHQFNKPTLWFNDIFNTLCDLLTTTKLIYFINRDILIKCNLLLTKYND